MLIKIKCYIYIMTGKGTSVGSPPDGYNSVTPYLVVHRASDLIKFLVDAFGAVEKMKFTSSDGTITHAEMSIGNSIIMLKEANASNPATPTNINLYVENVDGVYEKALKSGASSISEPADQVHGERTGIVKDSAGNQWWISAQIEKLSEDEIKKRIMESGR